MIYNFYIILKIKTSFFMEIFGQNDNFLHNSTWLKKRRLDASRPTENPNSKVLHLKIVWFSRLLFLKITYTFCKIIERQFQNLKATLTNIVLDFKGMKNSKCHIKTKWEKKEPVTFLRPIIFNLQFKNRRVQALCICFFSYSAQ